MVPHLDWYHDLKSTATMPPPSPSAPRRTRTTQIVLFLVFAFWLPWAKGVQFLDSVLLGAYACLGVVFAAPMAAESRTVLRPVLTGLALSWALLLLGILVVYATRNVVVGPDLRTVLECAIFGAALSTACASGVAYLAEVTSLSTARLASRFILLALLAAFFLYSGWLPDFALRGAAISTAFAAIILFLRRQRA